MAEPTGATNYQDEFLTNLAVGFAVDQTQFIADQVFPQVSVPHKTGKFWTFSRQDFMRLHAQRRAPGAESAGGQYSRGTDTYALDVWAFHHDVDAQEIANADRRFSLETESVEFVTLQLLLAREYVFQQAFWKTGVWTGSTTGTDLAGGTDFDYFDDPGADIIGAIEAQTEEMRLNTGLEPNLFIIGRPAWRKARQNEQMLEAIKYTQRGVVTRELFAELIGMPVIIADATYDASVDGSNTPSPQWFYGNSALMIHRAPVARINSASAGYIFTWDAYSSYGINVYSFDNAATKSRRFEGEFTAGPEVVSPELGIFFNNVTTP